MTIVVDTSAILALFDESYVEHKDLVRIIDANDERLVVSPLVVAEADHMLYTRLGSRAARDFASDVAGGAYELAEWTSNEHAAALAVIGQYRNDYVGVADASNVVIADRERTDRIMTLDQRHFRTLRPLWGFSAFVLLPYDA
ncbi:PIN domain-containing protein [Nocardia aurantia]|uniref:Ribonuclease VapC n=1 Tax=Nocardia aurantia TaxID=2585199 RepID=A0A7K0DJI5_9NOCA|nr:PIN domain-containing protein [Nocardia aurantia]MQY24944.1 Ribonuclease VapC26 [Nocardia aurantia]